MIPRDEANLNHSMVKTWGRNISKSCRIFLAIHGIPVFSMKGVQRLMMAGIPELIWQRFQKRSWIMDTSIRTRTQSSF
jgi:hypothetical protein